MRCTKVKYYIPKKSAFPEIKLNKNPNASLFSISNKNMLSNQNAWNLSEFYHFFSYNSY